VSSFSSGLFSPRHRLHINISTNWANPSVCEVHRSMIKMTLAAFADRTIHHWYNYIVYMRTYTHIHAYIDTNMHTYLHTYIHTYTHTYICTYIRKYIHTYIHTHTHVHTYRHTYTLLKLSVFTSAWVIGMLCLAIVFRQKTLNGFYKKRVIH
jgi:uncharacterized membrane protein